MKIIFKILFIVIIFVTIAGVVSQLFDFNKLQEIEEINLEVNEIIF